MTSIRHTFPRIASAESSSPGGARRAGGTCRQDASQGPVAAVPDPEGSRTSSGAVQQANTNVFWARIAPVVSQGTPQTLSESPARTEDLVAATSTLVETPSPNTSSQSLSQQSTLGPETILDGLVDVQNAGTFSEKEQTVRRTGGTRDRLGGG